MYNDENDEGFGGGMKDDLDEMEGMHFDDEFKDENAPKEDEELDPSEDKFV